MKLLRRAAGGFRALLAGTCVDRDLDEELRQYLQSAVDEKMRTGMTHEAAVRAARVEIGSLEAVKDEVRDVGWESRLETLWRDVQYALRMLRASPGFTLVAILTLALGIGANTAIFGVVNSLLLRPLPVKDPERLVVLVNGRGRSGANTDVWEQLRQQSDLFDGVLAWSSTQFNLGDGGQAQWVDGITASGSFFATLGVSAVAGRTLSEADDRPGGGPDGPVAVISYSLWQRRFGGTANAVGRALTINRVLFTIVGVTPPDFFGPAVGRSFDVIVPLGDYPLLMSEHGIANNWLSVMARRKPGQTLEQASAALGVAQDRMRRTARFEAASDDLPAFTLRPATTGYSQVRGQYARPLFTVLAVVALVLLIACANLASLLLARGTARRHELSARLALGASRSRLVQQLLTESLVLAAIGAAGGVVIAWWGSRLLVKQLSSEALLTIGRIMFGSAHLVLDLSLDWRMLAFTAAVTVGAVLMFGLAPALRTSAISPIDVFKKKGITSRSRHSLGGGSRTGLTGWLVVSQVALSLVLVVAAGLLVRTFSSLATVHLGFEPDRVLVVDIASPNRAVEPTDNLDLYQQVLERVRALPGVAEATVSNVPPFNGFGVGVEVSGASEWLAGAFISPGWFRTFGTPLVAGRDFTDRDRAGAPRVAVVNQSFARAFLRGSPLGQTMTLSTETPGPPVEIVGVVADIASSSLREDPPPVVYIPLAQVDRTFGADILQISLEEQGLSLSVRAERGSPMLLSRDVVNAVNTLSPEWMLTIRSLSGEVAALLTQERVIAMLSGFFGVLALLLAAVGLYGVTSYSVALRRTEMGIRLALGADRLVVLRAILRQSLALTGVGIILGLGASAAVTPYLEALLWGTTPLDPMTFVGVPIVFAVVATLAAFIPARRATRVDPLVALRCD